MRFRRRTGCAGRRRSWRRSGLARAYGLPCGFKHFRGFVEVTPGPDELGCEHGQRERNDHERRPGKNHHKNTGQEQRAAGDAHQDPPGPGGHLVQLQAVPDPVQVFSHFAMHAPHYTGTARLQGGDPPARGSAARIYEGYLSKAGHTMAEPLLRKPPPKRTSPKPVPCVRQPKPPWPNATACAPGQDFAALHPPCSCTLAFQSHPFRVNRAVGAPNPYENRVAIFDGSFAPGHSPRGSSPPARPHGAASKGDPQSAP